MPASRSDNFGVTVMRNGFLRSGLAAALLGSACSENPPPVPAAQEPAQGRAETQNIREIDALGYDGAAIGDKVDQVLDANDARKGQLDEAIDNQ